jgi:hypothetical protein
MSEARPLLPQTSMSPSPKPKRNMAGHSDRFIAKAISNAWVGSCKREDTSSRPRVVSRDATKFDAKRSLICRMTSSICSARADRLDCLRDLVRSPTRAKYLVVMRPSLDRIDASYKLIALYLHLQAWQLVNYVYNEHSWSTEPSRVISGSERFSGLVLADELLPEARAPL